jgi:outer membrane receptor protein involved in Fe transport
MRNFKFFSIILYFIWAACPSLVWSQDEGSLRTGSGENSNLDVLTTITVQAERPDWENILSQGTVDVVLPDDFAGEQKDLSEFLEMVPGLHVNRRGGDGQYSTLTVRGSTSAQVSVYVDGVLQNLSGDAVIDLSLIPIKNVARIEVYRGYIPVRFTGSPIGGAINIVTKKPEGIGVRAAIGIKPLNGKEGEVTVTAPLLGGSLMLGAHHERSDGDFEYDYLPGAYLQNIGDLPIHRRRQSNGYMNSDVLLKWQDEHWYIKGAWKRIDRFFPQGTNGGWQLANASTQYTDLGMLEDVPSNASEGLVLIRRISEHRNQVVEQYEIIFGRRQEIGNLEFGVELNYLKNDKAYRLTNLPAWALGYLTGFPTGDLWTNYENSKYGASIDGSLNLWERNLVEFRLDFSLEKQRLDGNKKGSNEPGGFTVGTYLCYDSQFPDGCPYPHRVRDSYSRRYLNIQISDTLTLGENKDLWITITGRYQSVKDSVDDYPEFVDVRNKASFTWAGVIKKKIGEHLTLRVTGGKFSRYPTFYELYGDGVYIKPADLWQPSAYEAGYQRPKMETGNQWDIGLDWTTRLFDSNIKLSAIYFRRNTSDTIGIGFRRDGTMYYINVGNTVADGFEMQMELRWPIFDISGGATLLFAEFEHDDFDESGLIGTNIPPGQRLLLQPRWEANVRANLRLFDEILGVFVELHFTDTMMEARNDYGYEDRFNFIRDALQVTNVGFRLSFPFGFTLTAGINDLFDKRPEQGYTIPGRGGSYGSRVGLMFPLPGRTWFATLEYAY